MKDGAEITPIKGLTNGELHPFTKSIYLTQCFSMRLLYTRADCSAIGLLKEGKAKNKHDVKELMSGNICRCGAYSNIIDAIMEVKEGGVYE